MVKVAKTNCSALFKRSVPKNNRRVNMPHIPRKKAMLSGDAAGIHPNFGITISATNAIQKKP